MRDVEYAQIFNKRSATWSQRAKMTTFTMGLAEGQNQTLEVSHK